MVSDSPAIKIIQMMIVFFFYIGKNDGSKIYTSKMKEKRE